MDMTHISSPAYVLEEEKLRKNLLVLQQIQERAGISIILSLKGFAMWKIFPLVNKYLKGATASSLYEARLCFEEMGQKAHTYCVAYSPLSIQEILSYSSHLTFNSLSEFQRYLIDIVVYSDNVSIGIRVNPGFSNVENTSGNPSRLGSRLGETVDSLPDILPKEIEGLHFHTLSDAGVDSMEEVITAFEQKFEKYMPSLKWVNMGGGHLLTAEEYETNRLISMLTSFKKKHEVDIILEPGSAISWESGVLIASVLDVVKRDGMHTAILDISFNTHIPDVLALPYRPQIRGAREPKPGDSFVYRLGGRSCLAGDVLSAYAFPTKLLPGDKLVFENMIQYTMVKTSMFNGLPHPQIGIWKEDQSYEVIRTFGYEDYKGRLS